MFSGQNDRVETREHPVEVNLRVHHDPVALTLRTGDVAVEAHRDRVHQLAHRLLREVGSRTERTIDGNHVSCPGQHRGGNQGSGLPVGSRPRVMACQVARDGVGAPLRLKGEDLRVGTERHGRSGQSAHSSRPVARFPTNEGLGVATTLAWEPLGPYVLPASPDRTVRRRFANGGDHIGSRVGRRGVADA